MTSWGRFQRRFDGIIDDLKAHEDLVDKTSNAIGLSDVRNLADALEDSRQKALEKLAKEEERHTAMQYTAIVGWLKIDEADQVKAFDSIASEASNNPGTCDWILKQPRIQSWMRCNHEASFLILHGHPGTGKSVLAAQIATFLRAAGNSSVITHFCTYSYATS